MSAKSSNPALRNTDGARSDLDQSQVTAPSAVVDEIKGELVKSGVPANRVTPLAESVVSMVVARSGPLPSVEEFEGYDQICPGAARDILNMALKQQDHVHKTERWELLGEICLKVLGIMASLAIVAGFLVAAAYCASIGQPWLGLGFVAGGAIVTSCSIFMRNFIRQDPSGPAQGHTVRKSGSKKSRRKSQV